MASREEKNNFSMMIVSMAISENIDHMDAITTYCERNNLEIEIAASLINDTLKDIIQNEAMECRYLPRQSKLPL